MFLDLTEYADALDDSPFEEIPVDLDTFIGKDYLGEHFILSPIQRDLVECMSQIFTLEDCTRIYGHTEGIEHYRKYTKKEVIMMLGKGPHPKNQRFYAVDKGYVDTYALGRDPWIADSRHEPQPAFPFFSVGPSAIYRLTTKHGYSFECAKEHNTPVWRSSRHGKTYSLKKNPELVEVTDINVGDFVELKAGWTESTSSYACTADEARLIGYMIGDGSFIVDNNNPIFTNATPEVQDDFVRIIMSLGGKISHGKSGKGCWNARVSGINDWFVRHGLVRNMGEQKPWNYDWMRMSHDNMLELVRGVIATDGWFSFTNPGKKIGTGTTKLPTTMIGIEMTSEECVRGLHLMLLHLGIISKFKLHRPERHDGKHKANYRVATTDSSYTKMLIEMLGHIPGKQDQVDRILNMEVKGVAPLSRFDRVASVEYLREDEDTVCTTVAVEGVVNAGGIITSNSGKDFTSTVGCAYLIYKLLCLKDPAQYFGKVSGDAIDIINIAINAEQAKNVFFKGFVNRIKKAPWFKGKYSEKTASVEFPKGITLYSGHSERESHEGLNLVLAILDEISGFAQTSNSGNTNAKTSDAIYSAFRGAVDSRFPDYGKVVLLSFPRYEGDFISEHYDRMIKEKTTALRRHRFIIDPELAPTEDNVFEITWEEDTILQYTIPNKIYAVKAPSWEVNPGRSIEDYKDAFILNPNDAYQRFACKPTAFSDGLFRDPDALRDRMMIRNPVDELRRLDLSWVPKENTTYFLHADLAQKQDRAAVAMAHVEGWVNVGKIMDYEQIQPVVVVDFVVWWDPQQNMPIDLKDVSEWIINLKRRGINIGRVTTDQWNCLPAGSPVYTPNGIKYIEDIREGDLVSTRFGPSMVGSTRNSGVQEVFRVKSKLGYEITGTASHKVLTTCGWKTIGQLTVEDRIVVSNNVGATTDGDLTTDQAYVLGALIADGWCGHKNDDWVGLTTADDVFIDAVRVAAKRGFGFDKQIIGKDQIVDGVLSKAKNYTFVGRKFVRQLRALGLDRSTAKNKHVPHSVMTASPEAKASFLAGYIDGDGGVQSYTDRNGHYRQRLTMDTVSDRLSEELRYLLLSLGLEPCLMSTDKVTNKGPVSYTRITLEGNKGAKALSIIKPFLLRKASVDSVGKTMYTFVDNELSLPIKSIESAGMVQTYDISVPETEEFICGGVVTHNSVDFQKQLNSIGIKSDTLSVARREYDDLVLTVYDKRVILPSVEILLKELLQLKIINDRKVDHPRSGSKDLADAVAGAVHNAIAWTPRGNVGDIEIRDMSNRITESRMEDLQEAKPEIPAELEQWLERMRAI